MITSNYYVFGQNSKKPNTFIGGVASTITNATQLASRLGISIARIQNFTVTSSDISCQIEGIYTMKPDAFFGDNSLTYFKDDDRLVQSMNNGSFANCANLEVLELYGLKNLSGGGLAKISNTKIKTLYFPEMTSLSGNGSIVNNSLLHTVSAPIATEMPSGSTLGYNPSLMLVNIPKCKKLGIATTNNNSFINCANGCVVICDISLFTANSGQPDGDLINNNLYPVFVGGNVSDFGFNTVIGGLASAFPTASSMQIKLGIAPVGIQNYEIVGNDVRFYSSYNFTMPSSVFRDSNLIKSFVDNGNRVINLNTSNHFRNCAELLELRMNGVVLSEINNSFYFAQSPKLSTVYLEATTRLTQNTFNSNTALSDLHCNNVEIVEQAAFNGNHPNLAVLNIKKCKSFGKIGFGTTVFGTDFTGAKMGIVININSANLTSDSGSLNAQLVALKAQRSAIINFYDDAGVYVSTL